MRILRVFFLKSFLDNMGRKTRKDENCKSSQQWKYDRKGSKLIYFLLILTYVYYNTRFIKQIYSVNVEIKK